jgi:hypothetical protein
MMLFEFVIVLFGSLSHLAWYNRDHNFTAGPADTFHLFLMCT